MADLLNPTNSIEYDVRGRFLVRDAKWLATMRARVLSLEEVFPGWMDAPVFFNHLIGFQWNQDTADAMTLDLDYIGNRSGDKIASKLIHKMIDANKGTPAFALTDANIERLAQMVKMRYTAKWNALWTEFAQPDWFENVSLTTSEIGTESSSGSGESNETADTNYDETGSSKKTGGYEDTITPAKKEVSREGGWKDSHNGDDKDTLDTTGSDNWTETTTGGYKDTHVDKGTQTIEKSTDGTIGTSESHTGTDTREITLAGHKDEYKDNSKSNVFGFSSVGDTGNPEKVSEDKGDTTRTYQNPESNKFTHGETVTGSKSYTGFKETTKTTPFTESTNERVYTGQGMAVNKTRTPLLKEGRKIEYQSDVTRLYEDYKEITSQQSPDKFKREYFPDEGELTSRNKSGNTSLTKSGDYTDRKSRYTNANQTLTGRDYRRIARIPTLIELFSNHEVMQFFEIVFSDIDTILTT